MESKAPADVGKIELGLIRRVEQQNREKLERLRKITRKNNWTGWGLVGIVFSIYGYSMWAIKQERIDVELDQEFLEKQEGNK